MSTKTTTLTASSLSRTLRALGWNTGGPVHVHGSGVGRVVVSVDTGTPIRDARVCLNIARELRDVGYQVQHTEMDDILWVERTVQA